MNSGKSDTLIKTAYNYTERGLDVITLKPSIDTKGSAKIVARAGGERPVDILVDPDMNVREQISTFRIETNLANLACILADESQFFQPRQVDQLFEVAKLDNISVIAYGLRTDFLSNVFPGSRRLFEVADNIEKLPTMCRCGSQAEFNCRKVGDDYVFSGEQVAIDGEQETTYESLCGTCYLTERARALA